MTTDTPLAGIVVCKECGRQFSPGERFGGHVDVERRRVCPGGDPRV